MAHTLYKGDLPPTLTFKDSVAVDTETMGLNLARDRLCLVQISGGDGHAHLVKIDQNQTDAPNLKKLFENPDITKIFHYARFDVAVLKTRLGITCTPVYCTKVASRLCRTFTDKHGLKDLVRETLGIDLNKHQQTSDWGVNTPNEDQLAYAAHDVLHLHQVRNILDTMLKREGRHDLALKAMQFLNTRADLDLAGWDNVDIFAH